MFARSQNFAGWLRLAGWIGCGGGGGFILVFPKLGYHFGGLNNKDNNILGSILGSPYLWKLPYEYVGVM